MFRESINQSFKITLAKNYIKFRSNNNPQMFYGALITLLLAELIADLIMDRT